MLNNDTSSLAFLRRIRWAPPRLQHRLSCRNTCLPELFGACCPVRLHARLSHVAPLCLLYQTSFTASSSCHLLATHAAVQVVDENVNPEDTLLFYLRDTRKCARSRPKCAVLQSRCAQSRCQHACSCCAAPKINAHARWPSFDSARRCMQMTGTLGG